MQKFSKQELRMAQDVFGTFKERVICTDAEDICVGDEITLTNSNCEFEFDNYFGVFSNDLYYRYIVDLELISTDYREFVPEKSNNGGCYAYATAKVVKVYEKSY